MAWRCAAWLVMVVLGGAAGAAQAQRFGAPTPLRITAYVGTQPEGVQIDLQWTVRVGKANYALFVQRLETLSGSKRPADIIQAFAPYPVPLTIQGDPEQLAKITGAPPGQQLVISGNLLSGPSPFTMLVSKVERPRP